MIEMDDIRKIVKLVLLSGYLKGHKPLSLLLVSKAGNGKTEAITKHKTKRVAFMTDLSYRGVLDILKKDPKLKHFIVPDFLKITMKRRSTSDNLISLLNALTEDGVGHIQMYNYNEDFGMRQVGIIIATTKASYSQHAHTWDSIGFTSRMIFCSYDYRDATIDKILDYINSDAWLREKTIERLTGYKDVEVISSKELNSKLNKHARRKFRTLKQLQTLAKCNAIMNHRREVNQDDIDEIIRLSKYLNQNYTKI